MTQIRSRSIKTKLAEGENFSIDLVVKNDYTHSVQISHVPPCCPEEATLSLTLPVDPTDNTLAGVINHQALHKSLGDKQAAAAVKLLMEVLPKKIGAKELLLMPVGMAAEGYVVAPESKLNPLKQNTSTNFLKDSAAELAKYPALVKELNANYYFVKDEKAMLGNRTLEEGYREVAQVLDENARFTPD